MNLKKTRPLHSSYPTKQPFFRPAQVFPKLTVNAPGDAYEQQADAMADRVMRMEEEEDMMQAMPLDGAVQRKCAACEEEEESLQAKPLLRKAESGGGFEASPELAGQLGQSKGGGASLPEATQGRMSRAFGADFSGVRVHTGGQAVDMSQSIQARAFTHGSDIYFNEGQYQPGSNEGDHLLAHELTHVVQQNGTRRLSVQREGPGDIPAPSSSTSDVGTLNLRLRSDGRFEILYGTPGLPGLGSGGIGLRLDQGRLSPVFGADPADLGNRTYSLPELRDLLGGFGRGSSPGTTPATPGFPLPTFPSGGTGSGLPTPTLLPPVPNYQLQLPPLDFRSMGTIFSTTIDDFAQNSAEVPASAETKLTNLVGILNLYSEAIVFVEGHTSSEGATDFNQQLSVQRAEAVRGALLQRGLRNPERLQTEGKGETGLRYPEESTAAQRSGNRRVEVWYVVRRQPLSLFSNP